MTRKELKVIVCALLTTIAEFSDDLGAPEGILYAGLMGRIDHATFSDVVNLLISADLVERRAGPVLIATVRGRALAEKANNAISQVK